MGTFTYAFTTGHGRAIGAAVLAIIGVVAEVSCTRRSDDAVVFSPSPVDQLSIEGPGFVELGGTASFKALLRNPAGQLIRDVTAEVQWTSSDPAVLWVEQGLARGLTPGYATLQARLDKNRTAVGVGVDIRKDAVALPASLVIERLTVDVSGQNGYFGYLTRFLLRETTGQSGATILGIVVAGPSGSDATGPGCWIDKLWVPPGGTLDTFYTDAGLDWLLYCAPGSGGRERNPQLRVRVTFIDDGGREGIVEAVTVTK